MTEEYPGAVFAVYDRYNLVNNQDPYIGVFTQDNVNACGMTAKRFERLLYIGSFTIKPFVTSDGVVFNPSPLTPEQEVIRDKCFARARSYGPIMID